MPKKTKKEKIIAQYRRKLQHFHANTSVEASQISPLQDSQRASSSPPFAFHATMHASQNAGADIQPMDQAIHASLIKTLLLAFIAIGSEVALSVLIKK